MIVNLLCSPKNRGQSLIPNSFFFCWFPLWRDEFGTSDGMFSGSVMTFQCPLKPLL